MSGRRPADDPVLRALRGVCGEGFARAGGPADTVAGRPARYVAAPGTPAAAAALLALARDSGHSVTPRGAGTKIDWGVAPGGVDLLLDTGRLAGVWGHAAQEATAEVGAGTPVRAVHAMLAQRGQRLAVDPPSPGATLGGVLATDESGPLRHGFGSPGEQLVAVRYVDRHGRLADATTADGPAGGLWADAEGPGVLVSATVRVHPLPASRVWVSRPVQTPLEVHQVVRRVLAAGCAPAAVEVDLPGPTPAQMAFGAVSPGTVAVLLEGDAAELTTGVDALVAALDGNAVVAADPPPWWGRYPFTADEVAIRITIPGDDLHAGIYALGDAAGTAVPVRGSAGLGVVHAALPGDTPPQRVTEIMDAVRGVLLGRGGRCVVLSAPPGVRDLIDVEGDD